MKYTIPRAHHQRSTNPAQLKTTRKLTFAKLTIRDVPIKVVTDPVAETQETSFILDLRSSQVSTHVI